MKPLGYKTTKQLLLSYGIIFMMSVAALIIRLAKFEAFSFEIQVILFVVSFFFGVAMWEGLRYIHRFLNQRYPFEKNITGRIVIQITLGAVYGLFIRFIIYRFGEPHIPLKLDSMFVATTWALYAFITVSINLGYFTSYFLDRWKDSIVYAERLEREKSQVQFDNLKNQLNPHFLFNALTSLNSLIFENQKLASDFLQQLARVYRYVLQNKDKNFVVLTTELEFIMNYVKLITTRFQGAVTITFNIDEQACDKAIVPVTLQILIENAIKHNIADATRPLRIEIVSIGDYLVVSNNLQPKNKVEGSNKQGLDNLRSLYNFLTTKPLVVEQMHDHFFVKIPLL